jgi:cyclohexa-1,5-dienecarbonyl-CoA hydratase
VTGPVLRIAREPTLGLCRLTLDHGKGNVLDSSLVAALTAGLRETVADPQVRAIVLDAAGKDFCFGASVEEHLPPRAEGMLRALHRLLLSLVEAPVPVVVAVQGKCLGGGLELALAGSRIIASADALLGQPEVKLGVFAPAASALLPERVGQAAAEELLVTGRSLKAHHALALGLIDDVAIDETPAERALLWVEHHLLTHSVSGLRFACRAARLERAARFAATLPRLEKLYLEELMPTPDATEGLKAFLEKRAPKWEHGART